MTCTKGKTGNPKGRPKTWDENNIQNALHKQASKDCEKIYKILKKEMKEGKEWAIKLFFQEILPKVKNKKEDNIA